MLPTHLHPPIQAVTEILAQHHITPDRHIILQDGNTLVVRLTQTLVARIVQDKNSPRQGTSWFTRENAIAHHLTSHNAPIIPLHPDLPPGPHFHLGYPFNFWQFVTSINTAPNPTHIGQTLHQCHQALHSFQTPLPHLAIITESLNLLKSHPSFPPSDAHLLHHHLENSLATLQPLPHQPLHGDAHMGNLINTTTGLLWTDWEDAFSGPIEWDLASIIWNARCLDNDHPLADTILQAYTHAGGNINPQTLQQCLIARAAVMSAWYPILYPNPTPDRQAKLQHRLTWLRQFP